MAKKIVTMTVEVSVPEWLTPAQASKEVRTLIAEQCFWGHQRNAYAGRPYEEISEDNFKVRSVKSAPGRKRE